MVGPELTSRFAGANEKVVSPRIVTTVAKARRDPVGSLSEAYYGICRQARYGRSEQFDVGCQ